MKVYLDSAPKMISFTRGEGHGKGVGSGTQFVFQRVTRKYKALRFRKVFTNRVTLPPLVHVDNVLFPRLPLRMGGIDSL